MTNPHRENGSRLGGNESNETLAEAPPETGRQTAHRQEFSGAAGTVSEDAARQFTIEETVKLLVQAISELERSGKVPVAAGVSARMRILEPNFSVRKTPFASFRQIVQAAEDQGLVSATVGSSDLLLSTQVDPKENAKASWSRHMLRRDLWSAILDWSDDATHGFSPETGKVFRVEGPLQDGHLAVPKLDQSKRIDCVRKFALLQREDQSAALDAALQASDPLTAVQQIFKSDDALRRRWNRYLRQSVLETATSWAETNNVPERHIFEKLSAGEVGKGRPQTSPLVNADDRENETRKRVLEVLAAMPMHELLRLPIPLEYSLTR